MNQYRHIMGWRLTHCGLVLEASALGINTVVKECLKCFMTISSDSFIGLCRSRHRVASVRSFARELKM